MKKTAFFVICLSMIYNLAFAEGPYFNFSTLTLEIPCVRLVPSSDSQICYPVSLLFKQTGSFAVTTIGNPFSQEPKSWDATFDLQSLILSLPSVAVEGMQYEASLTMNPSTNEFTITSIKEIGTTQTRLPEEYVVMGSCGNDLFGICADFFSRDSSPEVLEKAQRECLKQMGTWSDQPCEPNYIKECELTQTEIYKVVSYLYNEQSESFFDGLCAAGLSATDSNTTN